MSSEPLHVNNTDKKEVKSHMMASLTKVLQSSHTLILYKRKTEKQTFLKIFFLFFLGLVLEAVDYCTVRLLKTVDYCNI